MFVLILYRKDRDCYNKFISTIAEMGARISNLIYSRKEYVKLVVNTEYAAKNKVEYENTLDGVRLHLYSGEYKYWFYEIEPAENGKEKVKIYLERV